MRDITRGNHAEIPRGIGQRGSRFRAQHITFEGFLALQQFFVCPPLRTQLIGTFCSVGRQPQGDRQADTESADDKDDERDPGDPDMWPQVHFRETGEHSFA
ncbi:Uncharacterised protein [Mycobacteroides abscessus subsp. abscessus]|nr:Uncharacterised protein [Mycobacteroides abscessus subsp. abscessus]